MPSLCQLFIVLLGALLSQGSQPSTTPRPPLCTSAMSSSSLPTWIITEVINSLQGMSSKVLDINHKVDRKTLCQFSMDLLDRIFERSVSDDASLVSGRDIAMTRFPSAGSLPADLAFVSTRSIHDTKIPVVTITEYSSPLRLDSGHPSKIQEKITTPTPEPVTQWVTDVPIFMDFRETTLDPAHFGKDAAASSTYILSLEYIAQKVLQYRQSICVKEGRLYSQSLGRCFAQHLRKHHVIYYGDGILNETVEHQIILCGISSSITTLSFLLVIYGVLKKLRVLIGKSVICLSVVALLNSMLQLVVAFLGDVAPICRITAVLLHWGYLAMLAWIGIICFDILVLFVQPLNKFSKENKFSVYLVIGFSLPTLVATVCIIIDFTTQHRIGYGANRICFVGHLWSNFFSLVIFAICLVPFSAFCVGKAIIGFYGQRHRPRTILVREQYSRKDLVGVAVTTLKVTLLITLPWLFGFIGALIENAVLLYLFLVLTYFQGAFLFLAFVCNKRVFQFAKQYYEYRLSVKSVNELRKRARNSSLRVQGNV